MNAAGRERLLFGEWLVHEGRLGVRTLAAALAIQNAERSMALRSSPRLLGQILLDDFQVFRNRVELNQNLVEFSKVKPDLQAVKDEQRFHGGHSPGPGPGKTAAVSGPASSEKGPERALFGQFLIEKKKVNRTILDKAVEIQDLESNSAMRASHRLLGEILMDDFKVFGNRVELNRMLIEFKDFKSQLEVQRTELMSITRKTF